MTAAAPSCTVEFRVRYAETDQMGIVYHANYLPWCEIGRTELIRRLWKSYAQVEREDGVLLAVTDVALRYHAAARYDDLIRVTTTLEGVRSRAVAFTYLVERVNDGGIDRLVSARTGLTAIDRHGALRTLPPELLAAFRNPVPELG
ncbi:MAG: 4-hydroxybenzoyl-CoA thioesterase family active site [uncultured Gemmatimonadetes bacterium]|uniref:4-hydroxybenzoyl-CoA thioesterase family active site n=1 Tax=uncultured Gemmatimonadota bacterium TaxID=203437 RepID=A0A6J4M5B9_9BACT|nr:MAG: 4-hydroxybenzoyl-CoA thioesterase family active site [uncultured Gemmatimonadota bacterium]